eukprot:15326688-Ditylum_brightwellii.AAC.1
MKMANFHAVVAVTKRDIESGVHRLHMSVLDPKKYICKTKDDTNIISIILEDKESSGCKSSSSFAPSSGLLSSCMSSDVSTTSSSLSG